MSNPDNAATQQPAESLEQRVNQIMKESSFDETTGKVILPEGLAAKLDADTLFAVTAEHRRRNTQSAYTKGQVRVKALEAEKTKLMEILSGNFQVVIPPEEKERLEKLKYEDPDKWREEIDSIEKKALGESRARVAELTGEASGAAELSFELERRQQVLEEFNASAKTPITDAIIADEVPPRITKKLAEGKITFENFLQEVADYLEAGKSVKSETVLKQPNLGKIVGGNKPNEAKAEESVAKKYKKVLY